VHVWPEQQDWPLLPQTWQIPEMHTPSAPQEVPSAALIPVSRHIGTPPEQDAVVPAWQGLVGVQGAPGEQTLPSCPDGASPVVLPSPFPSPPSAATSPAPVSVVEPDSPAAPPASAALSAEATPSAMAPSRADESLAAPPLEHCADAMAKLASSHAA
jgi:hypothetical protein